MSRKKALEMLNNPSYDEFSIKEDIKFIANKLRISEKELISYLHIPLKTYKDYKNNRYIYDLEKNTFFYRIRNRIKR